MIQTSQDSLFMYKIVPVSYFLHMVLSPHGLAVQHHSLPPFPGTPHNRCSYQDPQPAVFDLWISRRGEQRGHCAVLNFTYIGIYSKSLMCWSMYIHCHHVTWHTVLGASKPSLPGFSFLLSATTCPHQPAGRQESLVPSAAACTYHREWLTWCSLLLGVIYTQPSRKIMWCYKWK